MSDAPCPGGFDYYDVVRVNAESREGSITGYSSPPLEYAISFSNGERLHYRPAELTFVRPAPTCDACHTRLMTWVDDTLFCPTCGWEPA